MAILVTGATGFIGAHICRRLLRQGERVVGLDPMPSNVWEEVLTEDERAEIALVRGDVGSFRDVCSAIKEYGIDRVIHLASLLNPASDENPHLAIRVNISGHANVLEAARILGIKKVVWASSVVVFGPRSRHGALPLANDAPHFPNNNYAASKSYCEHLSELYRTRFGVDATGLRLTLVYGPGRVRGATAFVNELIQKPALGQPADVPFGDDVVDWQYVEDVARLFVTCLAAGKTKENAYNTRFDIRSIREAGDFVRSLLPEAAIAYRPGATGLPWELDDSCLQRDIGFEPEYSMERGVLAVMNHVRAKHGLPPLAPPPSAPGGR